MKYVFKKPLYRILIPLFDLLGYFLFLPAKLLCKKPSQYPKNILVVRLDHIGDFVCTTPVFKNIKKRFPNAKITVLINSVSKELAYRDPCIDKVITFSHLYLGRGDDSSASKGLVRVIKDIKNIGFDLGIDPRGDLLSIVIMWLGGVRYRVGYGITGGGFFLNKVCNYDRSKHVIDRNLVLLEALDVPIQDRMPEVYFNDKDEDGVERLLKEKGCSRDNMAVVIHPFAGTKAKEWPRENFQTLINYLESKGRDVLLAGSAHDIGSLDGVTDVRGKLNLPQLACLIKKTNFFIGLDSGPANIAAAVGAKSIVICSGTNYPELWLPKGDNLFLVQKDTDCKPCELKVCPEKRHKCMESINPEDVIKVIEKVWRV